MEDIYTEDSIEIFSDAFDKDFDEINWNPIILDDSDEEAEELYGLK